MVQSRSIRITLLFILIAGGALAFIAIPLWQLIIQGDLHQEVGLAAFRQGGIEALILSLAFAAALQLNDRKWRLLICLGLTALYLRRHAVDAAVVVDLLYVEFILALGAFTTKLCGTTPSFNVVGYLRNFVLGFLVWSTCAWVASALGWGSLRDLRVLTLILLIPALHARASPWCLFVEARVDAMPAKARFCAGLVIAWFLILFAHSATVFSYDNAWYGFRGERVLVGEGSVFVSQGLVASVHYFPKVYELFLLPLSGLGSSSVLAGITIFILGFLAAAVHELMRLLGIADIRVRLLCVAAVISVPAVANTALDVKGDLFSAFLLMMAWLHASLFLATRNRDYLFWTLALLCLSAQAKLTALPFIGVFLPAICIVAIFRRVGIGASGSSPVAIVALALAVLVSALATVRTWLLTGVPTIGPDPLFNLWLRLGLELTFPAGTMHWTAPKDWSDTGPLLVDILFRPQLTGHWGTWTGNVWLWMAAAALAHIAFYVRTPSHQLALPPQQISKDYYTFHLPGLSLALAGFAIMLCWGFNHPGANVRAGNGNYFIAGITATILLTFSAAWLRLHSYRLLHTTFVVALTAFCLSQAACSFLTADWTPGTRAFDLDFTRSPRQLRHSSKIIFKTQGLSAIARHLESLHYNARVVGCTSYYNALGYRLPARFEDIAQIAWAYPEYADTPAHFFDFLVKDRIEYLIVPITQEARADCEVADALFAFVAKLDGNAHIPILRDESYALYDIRELIGAP